MPYNHPIPDAPIAGSMLPRATELTLDDLLVLIQPGNPIGQKNKALTLQVLAAFLANTNLQEITLAGTNGKTLVLNGEGSVFTKPPTAGTLDRLTITEDSNGITIAVTGPTVNRTVNLSQTELSISRTQGGLETKITMDGSGITLSDQEREGSEVVTTERKLSPDHIDVHELQFFNDNFSTTGWRLEIADSTDIYAGNLKLSYTGSASGLGRFVLNDKLLALAECAFEKDVDINADVTVEKSLKLDGNSSPVLENKKGATNVNSLYFQSASTPNANSTLQFCSALSISGGSYTLPAHGSAATNLGHLKIIANDTDSNVQVYYRSPNYITLEPGQAAQFLWCGGTYGWFKFKNTV